MKTSLVISIVISTIIFSCTKTDVQQPVNGNINASETDLSVQASRTAVITGHTWMYQAYYFHYIDQAHKGDAQYIRGSSNNLVPLDGTRITYKTNGTFLETDQGYNYPGTWQFTDNADTAFKMVYNYGTTDNNSIITLNNNTLSYKHPIGSYTHNNFAYSELIPAQ
jgi:LPXTG-site transpeptidase (sortase) family protein